jgi:hypothetical protein
MLGVLQREEEVALLFGGSPGTRGVEPAGRPADAPPLAGVRRGGCGGGERHWPAAIAFLVVGALQRVGREGFVGARVDEGYDVGRDDRLDFRLLADGNLITPVAAQM